MVEKIILEESYVKVSYILEKKLVLVVWNGNVTTEQYQNAFNSVLNHQEASNEPVCNFLSDTRNQGMINPENRKWFETYCIPRAIKLGMKRGAVIYDGSVFKKYYLNIILLSTNKFKIPFKFFLSFEEAFAWFDSFGDC